MSSHPLEDLRTRSGKTVREVVVAADITRSCWYGLRRNKHTIYLSTASGLAAALGVSLDEITKRLL